MVHPTGQSLHEAGGNFDYTFPAHSYTILRLTTVPVVGSTAAGTP